MPRIRYGAERSLPRLLDLAAADQLTHARARYDLTVDFHRRHHVERDAGRRRKLGEPLDGAFAIVAKVKVGAFDQGLGSQGVANDLLEELGGRQLQQRFVRRVRDDPIDALRGEQLGLPLGPRERRRALLGTQESHRVRVEREHNRRSAHRLGPLQQSLHNGHVAAVDAVEIADRDGTAARGSWEAIRDGE